MAIETSKVSKRKDFRERFINSSSLIVHDLHKFNSCHYYFTLIMLYTNDSYDYFLISAFKLYKVYETTKM